LYKVRVDEKLCKGCLLCAYFCRERGAGILLKSDKATIFGGYVPRVEGECIGCRWCEMVCPDFAISVEVAEDC